MIKMQDDNAIDKITNAKKCVRFADPEGNPLCGVLTFTKRTITRFGYGHYNEESQDETIWLTLTFHYRLPKGLDFHRAINNNYVILEGTQILRNCITGIVIVRNVAYEKKVAVRYTWNDWNEFDETQAIFLKQIGFGLYDKFCFAIKKPEDASRRKDGKCLTLEFAIRYEVMQQQYWDNNNNKNYKMSFNC